MTSDSGYSSDSSHSTYMPHHHRNTIGVNRSSSRGSSNGCVAFTGAIAAGIIITGGARNTSNLLELAGAALVLGGLAAACYGVAKGGVALCEGISENTSNWRSRVNSENNQRGDVEMGTRGAART